MRKLSDLPEEMVLDDQVKQRILRNGRTIAQKKTGATEEWNSCGCCCNRQYCLPIKQRFPHIQ